MDKSLISLNRFLQREQAIDRIRDAALDAREKAFHIIQRLPYERPESLRAFETIVSMLEIIEENFKSRD